MWIQDFELEARDLKRADVAALEPLVQGSVPRRVARRHRERRIQPPAAVRRLERARDRGVARLLPLPAADRHSVQPGLHGARAGRRRRRSRAALVRLFETQFALQGRQRESAAERIAKGILRRARQGREPRRGPHPARLPARSSAPRCAPTTIRRWTGRGGTVKSWVSFKLDPHAIPDLPLPRPEVRDLRVQPARRRRAPAHGLRGARRHCAGPIAARTSAPKCSAS